MSAPGRQSFKPGTSLPNTTLRVNSRQLLMKQQAEEKYQNLQRTTSTSQSKATPCSSSYSNHFPGDYSQTAPINQIYQRYDGRTMEDHDIQSLGSYNASSTATSYSEVEVDTLFEDINDIVSKEINQPSLPSNFAQYGQTFDVGAHDVFDSTSHLKTSSSCPAIRSTAGRPVGRVKQEFPNPDSEEYQDLERRKKELHNNIEKKRRYKINDCIMELANLLPTSYDVDLNKKKGYILEKSIDYIQKLQRDSERKTELEKTQRELERQNRQLQLQLEALRMASSIPKEAVISRLQQQQQQHQQQQQLEQNIFVNQNILGDVMNDPTGPSSEEQLGGSSIPLTVEQMEESLLNFDLQLSSNSIIFSDGMDCS